jgi:hypothetical protein
MVSNYSSRANVTDMDMALLVKVAKIMTRLFDRNHDRRHSFVLNFDCHSICRAISLYLPELRTIDGSYAGYEHVVEDKVLRMRPCWSKHSWLLTPDLAIIDPHPVGIITLAPLLAVGKGKYAHFGGGLYIPDIRIQQSISNKRLWRRSQVAFQFIKQVMK